MENNSIYIVVTPFFPSPISWRGAYCYDFVRVLDRQQELKVGVESPCAMSTEVKGWDESSLVTGTIAILPMFVNWPWRMEHLGSKLASLSFGVYLIHPLFAAVVAIIARRYLSVPVDLWGMMTMWFAVRGAAIVIALFMGRIPVVRRFV